MEKIFLVTPCNDPVVIKINGRASFFNVSPLRDFINQMIQKNKKQFVIDFKNCAGIDSTFMGIIAGAALELKEKTPPGKIILCRLGNRNLELINNLGLNRLMYISKEGDEIEELSSECKGEKLKKGNLSESEEAKMILQAHESLVAIEKSNQAKFQDVITFLKNQTESSSSV